MLIALTRAVSESLAECQLTHVARQAIDVALARRQHAEYERALETAGCIVRRLPPAHDLPDAVFVEDTAVVLDEIAVLARPGAESRRPEVASVERALAPWRQLVALEAPATLDGGDVLRLGSRIFVGRSSRTNAAGVEQLRGAVARFGYRVEAVPLSACFHLKSAVTTIGSDALLLNPGLVTKGVFARHGFELIDVDASEALAANALLVGGCLIYPSAFPRTAARLRAHGIEPQLVDVSELAKAEGAVTCCSLIVAGP